MLVKLLNVGLAAHFIFALQTQSDISNIFANI